MGGRHYGLSWARENRRAGDEGSDEQGVEGIHTTGKRNARREETMALPVRRVLVRMIRTQ